MITWLIATAGKAWQRSSRQMMSEGRMRRYLGSAAGEEPPPLPPGQKCWVLQPGVPLFLNIAAEYWSRRCLFKTISKSYIAFPYESCAAQSLNSFPTCLTKTAEQSLRTHNSNFFS